jgi:hypothetical protein
MSKATLRKARGVPTLRYLRKYHGGVARRHHHRHGARQLLPGAAGHFGGLDRSRDQRHQGWVHSRVHAAPRDDVLRRVSAQVSVCVGVVYLSLSACPPPVPNEERQQW